MKKLLIAILLAALLVIPVPGTALAAPGRTVFAELDVAGGGVYDINYETGEVTGTVFYAGTVTDAVRQTKRLEGATISAQEEVHYWINEVGDIIYGTATGTITITGRGHDVLVINFSSDVSGNIFYGPASDVGTWWVTSASKSLHILKDATGTWTAEVTMTATGFVGKAWITGNL